MLVAARDAGVRRFVYAGSSSVYGDAPPLPKREDMTPRPLSPYAVGKLAGEHYVRIFASLYGMETLTLRYFNVFGPRQDPGSPYSGVISLFITALLEGRTPVIYGDGKQSRDFTYVANVVDGNLRALTAKGLEGQAVNVATGRRITLNALLEALARELGVDGAARAASPPRPGDIRHSLADIRRRGGCSATGRRVDFETGLRLTLDWYRGPGRGQRAPAASLRRAGEAGRRSWASQLFWNSGIAEGERHRQRLFRGQPVAQAREQPTDAGLAADADDVGHRGQALRVGQRHLGRGQGLERRLQRQQRAAAGRCWTPRPRTRPAGRDRRLRATARCLPGARSGSCRRCGRR